MKKKKVLVLGSTGSIGRATLEVIGNQPDKFEVCGLVCRFNVDLLRSQITRFNPPFACVYDDHLGDAVVADSTRVLTGMAGIRELISMDVDIVVNALPGSIGLEPTVAALKENKILALANKESLVMAGRTVRRLLEQGSGRLIPVDSEHSALYQLLRNLPMRELKTLMITASGGPFRGHSKEALIEVGPEEALNHPTWKMGSKITLDSATLMNKGLEVIEAKWLLDIDAARIKVLVHPESIIHGMVEFVDNGFAAYLSYPDMKIPISYALNEGERHPLPFGNLPMEEAFTLSFHPPDLERFPCLRLAYDALASGDSALITINSANEVASAAFLEKKIRFTDIPAVIEEALINHPPLPVVDTIDAVWDIHQWAKDYTQKKIREFYD